MSSENDILRARIHALEAENGKLRLDVDTLTVLVGSLTDRVDTFERQPAPRLLEWPATPEFEEPEAPQFEVGRARDRLDRVEKGGPDE